MALIQTTLAASVTASQLTLPLTSTLISGFPPVGQPVNMPYQLDAEFGFIKSVLVAGTPGLVQVARRGSEGSIAVAHDILATIVTSQNPADFPANPAGSTVMRPPDADEVVTLGQDQTITVQPGITNYQIAKATVAAITISPTVTPANVGAVLNFVSLTAAAHAITYVPGFNATTTASDTITFGGKIGDAVSVMVMANGTLTVLSSTNVTVG